MAEPTICVFCKIAARELPGSFAYEDDRVIVIAPLEPVNPGHMLVIPKKHVASLSELDEETGAYLFRVAMRTERAVRASGLRCEGTNILQYNGEVTGQTVFHMHVHVIPRFEGDGFQPVVERKGQPGRKELDEMAAKVKAGFPNPIDAAFGMFEGHPSLTDVLLEERRIEREREERKLGDWGRMG